ncbi:hypothetical protein E2C01_037834 [Portunus trituberculatus]|uniref:Uncharacterized protein n=1 Tax=Portunus trituberculatus TaxID=210409 RepID=A0A5B7F968_PORTR|nr:hypothetical protein [Portunus trituberculatus]
MFISPLTPLTIVNSFLIQLPKWSTFYLHSWRFSCSPPAFAFFSLHWPSW